MDLNTPQNKRRIFIIVSVVDVVLSGILLLIYFGFLPVDLSGLGLSQSVIGVIAGIWFLSALGVLVYQLTRTDVIE